MGELEGSGGEGTAGMANGPEVGIETSGDHEPLLALVGSQIRAARRRAKLKQSDVATAIGTKQSYIVGVEAGETNITLRTLARIAASLGVSPVELLLETEPGEAEARAGQLAAMLFAAMENSERLADFLRQAHSLIAGAADRSDPDVPG